MSARWQRRREARPTPRDTGIDPFEGLGPGDPGYRLRGGRSGFDPLETYQEDGRVLGLLLRSAMRRWYLRVPVLVLFAAIIVRLLLQGDVMTLVLIGGIAVAALLVWQISKQDLESIRRQRRDQ